MKKFLHAGAFTDVVFYGQYASTIAVVCAAKTLGINWRVIANVNHLGVDRRRLHINFVQTHVWTIRIINDWSKWREMPLANDEIEETGDDVLARFSGASFTTYSPPKTRDDDIFSKLGLDRNRQLIVAFTSSLDEYDAEKILDDVMGFPEADLPARPYANQIEWLTRLADTISGRDDLQLVIRIHPREDANKREGTRSRHLAALRRALADVPSNVRVVWPADAVSSYDLIEAAHLVQVWSSTIGLELARLGIPVIKLCRGYASYPEGDFAFSAVTHDCIVDAIDEALQQPGDLDRLIKAWRYYGFSRFAASLDLRDVLSDSELSTLPEYRRPAAWEEVTRAVFEPIPVWKINGELPRFLDQRLPPAEEAAAIRQQIRRILYAMFTGTQPPSDPPLYLIAPGSLHQASPSGSFAAVNDDCTLVWNGKLYHRYSPMSARLAALCGEGDDVRDGVVSRQAALA